jgi:hypothetical protein
VSSAASTDPGDVDPFERLRELVVLRDVGALSAAEFEAQKALVLSRSDSDWRAAPADGASDA